MISFDTVKKELAQLAIQLKSRLLSSDKPLLPSDDGFGERNGPATDIFRSVALLGQKNHHGDRFLIEPYEYVVPLSTAAQLSAVTFLAQRKADQLFKESEKRLIRAFDSGYYQNESLEKVRARQVPTNIQGVFDIIVGDISSAHTCVRYTVCNAAMDEPTKVSTLR